MSNLISLIVSTAIAFVVLNSLFGLLFKKTFVMYFFIIMLSCGVLGIFHAIMILQFGPWAQIFTFLIILPFLYVMVKVMNKMVVHPIKKLIKINTELSKGNTKIEIDTELLKKKNEIGEFSTSLAEVLSSLRASINIAEKVGNGFVGFTNDELNGAGDLDTALRNMVIKLREIITDISLAAENVATSSTQISSTAQNLSQGANEQASSTEEASASLEQMSGNISQNSENAGLTRNLTTKINEKISSIVDGVKETNDAMKSIVEKIAIINDIADRTDLLAINAAIEAARAGEHGKGFAVVASEVRELAESSLKSAMEIEVLSKESLVKAEKSTAFLIELAPEINKSSILVEEIAAASIEQKSGVEQVNIALQQLNQVTQQNASLSEEMATNSEELSSQAEKLFEAISFFKTTKDELDQYNIVEIENEINKFQTLLNSLKKKQSGANDEHTRKKTIKNIPKEKNEIVPKKTTGTKIDLEDSNKKTDEGYVSY